MSRKQAKRAAFYADQRRMRQEPCYCGRGQWDHDWRFVSDWYGDPGVINGTADCSFAECERCGAIDPTAEPPDFDDCYDYYEG